MEAVNAVGVTAKSTQEIRDKWKNLQSHAKREFSSFKSEQKKTGGGPAPPNPSEASLKIINMFSDTPSFTGLHGFETGKFNINGNIIAIPLNVHTLHKMYSSLTNTKQSKN